MEVAQKAGKRIPHGPALTFHTQRTPQPNAELPALSRSLLLCSQWSEYGISLGAYPLTYYNENAVHLLSRIRFSP